MTVTLVIPELPNASVWAILFVSCGLTGYVTHWLTRVFTDRSWERDIRKRVAQQLSAPWYCPGEPIVVDRVSAEVSIFKRRPYREEGFDLREAA